MALIKWTYLARVSILHANVGRGFPWSYSSYSLARDLGVLIAWGLIGAVGCFPLDYAGKRSNQYKWFCHQEIEETCT